MSGLLNTAYEYRNISNFTPYLGGSVGWAQQLSEIERHNLQTGELEKYSNRQHNFAWGALLGINWDFTRHWDVDFGYRFIQLGKVDMGTSSIGSGVTADEYISHDVLLTINYRF